MSIDSVSGDLEGRLLVWLDKLEIREVLERYMRYNDDRAADAIAELFHEDVRFQVMGSVVSGRDAVRVVFAGAGAELPTWTTPGELLKQPGSVHISSNPVIDVDGDAATAETDFLVVSAARTGAPGRASSAATATSSGGSTGVGSSTPAPGSRSRAPARRARTRVGPGARTPVRRGQGQTPDVSARALPATRSRG